MGARLQKTDITNWRKSPHNRWAFNHVREVLPISVIDNDPLNVSSLQRSEKSLAHSTPLRLFLNATETDAVLVLLDGKIAFEYYASGNDEHTPHVLMSASKSVVGLIVSKLENLGALDTSACVSDYLPEIAETPYGKVIIRELLDMRSGVKFTPKQQSQYMAAAGWDPILNVGDITGTRSFFANFTGAVGNNGGLFSYITANTDLLGWPWSEQRDAPSHR